MEIRLIEISKSFGKNQVIRPLSLTIGSGSFTTLLGPSGCGKTTLLRMIAGLETPDSGEIFFDDKCVFSAKSHVNVQPEKRGLGFVFQDFALWPHMTVFENVAFGLRARKDTSNLKERVMEALKTVELDQLADRHPHQLSGGQQQRVAFARAIVIKPSCVLFDEPLSALDAILREEMRHELKELVSREKFTSVFVTHDQTEAMSMSDRIAVVNKGEVEQYDRPETIYQHPKTKFVARFVGKSNWLSENSLVRPEALSVEEHISWKSVAATVTAVQYIGDSYEVMLQVGGEQWIMHAANRLESGEELTVYIDPERVITLEQ